VQKQVTSQQIGDQTAPDAEAKKAIMEASAAYVGQLEAMQSFKQITAPFDGVVTARNTDIGALINSGSAGQPLFEVVDLHRVRIYVQVPQAFTADLRSGLKATFEMPQVCIHVIWILTLPKRTSTVAHKADSLVAEIQTALREQGALIRWRRSAVDDGAPVMTTPWARSLSASPGSTRTV
jgi:multidrug efflux pump subunit AcrA (membrane-fusion protein)